MSEENPSLGTAFPKEIATAKEKLKNYKAIGPAGNFACSWIEPLIKEADEVWAEQDTIRMIQLLPRLKEIAY